MGLFGTPREILENNIHLSLDGEPSVSTLTTDVFQISLSFGVSLDSLRADQDTFCLVGTYSLSVSCETKSISHVGFLGSHFSELFLSGARSLGYGYFDRRSLYLMVLDFPKQYYPDEEYLRFAQLYKEERDLIHGFSGYSNVIPFSPLRRRR